MKPRWRYHWGHGLWYAVGGPVSRRQATWCYSELPRWPSPPTGRDPYKDAAKVLWPDKDKPA